MLFIWCIHRFDVTTDTSPLRPLEPTRTIPYDYLVYAVGAETQTFGIPGVKERACFMKEIGDAEQVRTLLQLPTRVSVLCRSSDALG